MEEGKDYRKIYPDVHCIAAINNFDGLVYDINTGDLILVGHIDPEGTTLTLDDLCVALRALFIHGNYPQVSIDPLPGQLRDSLQRVRFENGIKNTQFGNDLFQADYDLKRISFGIIPSGVDAISSYWQLALDTLSNQNIKRNVECRFWFYPLVGAVRVREAVATIEDLRVGVFTEVLNAVIDGKNIIEKESFHDQAADIFSMNISKYFNRLASVHPSFLKLYGLLQLAAISKAIASLDTKPKLYFWLNEYKVVRVPSKDTIEVLKRKEMFYKYLKNRRIVMHRSLSGGVELSAIVIRLTAGDITALRDAVLLSRTSANVLSWSFEAENWGTDLQNQAGTAPIIDQQYSHALFLIQNKYFSEAVNILSSILSNYPDISALYLQRALAYSKMKMFTLAIKDLLKAIVLTPNDPKPWCNLGASFIDIRKWDEAIIYSSKAIDLNPYLSDAYLNRGVSYREKRLLDSSLSDLNRAIELDPNMAEAYSNRAGLYVIKMFLGKAIEDCNKAILLNPYFASPYIILADIHNTKKQYMTAIEHCNYAIQLNPSSSAAFCNRAIAYSNLDSFHMAIADYDRAIKLDSLDYSAFSNRCGYYTDRGMFNEARKDCEKTIQLNKEYAPAYFNKGFLYERMGIRDSAVKEYSKALFFDSMFLPALNHKGAIFAEEMAFDSAFKYFELAVKINPNDPVAYYNIGLANFNTGKNDISIKNFSKAIERDSNYVQAYCNRAISLILNGELLEAMIDLKKAEKIDPEYVKDLSKKISEINGKFEFDNR